MQKTQWLDTARSIATLAVILVHILGVYINSYGSIDETSWAITTLFGSGIRFCVPFFLMLTGALLLNKDYTIKSFLKKRFSRILLPFLFWSIIYVFIQNNFQIDNSIKDLSSIFLKPTAFHLWYIYMLIGIYLIIPVVNQVTKGVSRNIILYYLLIWFAVLFFNLPLLSKLPKSFDLTYFSGYLGYVLLGFYLYRYSGNVFRYKKILFTIFLASVLFTFGFTYLYSTKYFKYADQFFNYLTPNIVLMSSSLFLLLMNSSSPHGKFTVLVNLISKYSYGIYLSHIATIMLLQFFLPHLFQLNLMSIIFVFLLCVIVSFVITYILNKLPFGKYFAG